MYMDAHGHTCMWIRRDPPPISGSQNRNTGAYVWRYQVLPSLYALTDIFAHFYLSLLVSLKVLTLTSKETNFRHFHPLSTILFIWSLSFFFFSMVESWNTDQVVKWEPCHQSQVGVHFSGSKQSLHDWTVISASTLPSHINKIWSQI